MRPKEVRLEEFNSLVELVNLNNQKTHKKIESKYSILEVAAKQLSQHVKAVHSQQQALQTKISEQQETLVSLAKQSSTLREALSSEVEENDEFKKKLKVALDKMNAKIHDNIAKMNESNQHSLQFMNDYKESLEKLHQFQQTLQENAPTCSTQAAVEDAPKVEEKENHFIEQFQNQLNQKVEEIQKQVSTLDESYKQLSKIEDIQRHISKFDDMQKQLTSTQIQVSNFKEMLNFVKSDVVKDPKLFDIVDKRFLVQYEPLHDRLEHIHTQLDNICHQVWYGELLNSTDPLDNVIFHELKKMNLREKVPVRKVKRGVYKMYDEFIVVSVIEDYVFATINNQHLLFQAFVKQRLTKLRQIDGFVNKATSNPVSLNIAKVNSHSSSFQVPNFTSSPKSNKPNSIVESKIPVLTLSNNSSPTITNSLKETVPLSARRVDEMVKVKEVQPRQPLSARGISNSNSPKIQKPTQHLSINLQPNKTK